MCRYLRQVAAGLRLGTEAAYWDMADTASAYLPLEARLPGVPQCDVALLWDGRRGWALGVEYSTGPGVLVLGYLGESVLPGPQTVVESVERALTGGGVGEVVSAAVVGVGCPCVVGGVSPLPGERAGWWVSPAAASGLPGAAHTVHTTSDVCALNFVVAQPA